MKKLLNTLYVIGSDRYLTLDGENIVVLSEGSEIGRVPLHNLEAVVSCGYTGASPALMGACAERGVDLYFMNEYGKFLAAVSGPLRGNVLLRKEQYRYSDDKSKSLKIAKNIIIGKLYNSRWVIERATRDYPLRLDVERLKHASAYLQTSILSAKKCEDIDSLRGIEGEAASQYFGVFDELILQQKEEFSFTSRNRRPPLDNVNAMLSFAYTLTTFMCASALAAVGLDPYVGFMHTDRPGRKSLALDMIEELRSVLADRFVLSLINRKMLRASDFDRQEDGTVIMNENGRKAFLSAWQSKKQETIVHPFLGEKLEWGMIPYVQALLLARHVRGDLEAYPPFFWK